MIYLTYADPLTGVYQSQVIDVCNYIDKTFNTNVVLVSIVSIKGYWQTRKKIKRLSRKAIVLPMFPTILLWKLNLLSLIIVSLFYFKKPIIARGVLASNLAFKLRNLGLSKRVCYDGRAAIAVEYEEYNVTPYKTLIRNAANREKKTVLKSDFRFAVSEKLIEYWKNRYGYNLTTHAIIPSTVNSSWTQEILPRDERNKLRRQFGLDPEKIILVYSGSTAGWQSFDLMSKFIESILKQTDNIQFMLLSQSSNKITDFHKHFKSNFIEKWVPHQEVEKFLKVCDYGILLRENSQTNRVAAPVKFAEYLSAGLDVLISENIGDTSEFVKNHGCGKLIKEETVIPELVPLSEKKQFTNQQLAIKFFTKQAHYNKYKMCFDHLSSNK